MLKDCVNHCCTRRTRFFGETGQPGPGTLQASSGGTPIFAYGRRIEPYGSKGVGQMVVGIQCLRASPGAGDLYRKKGGEGTVCGLSLLEIAAESHLSNWDTEKAAKPLAQHLELNPDNPTMRRKHQDALAGVIPLPEPERDRRSIFSRLGIYPESPLCRLIPFQVLAYSHPR